MIRKYECIIAYPDGEFVTAIEEFGSAFNGCDEIRWIDLGEINLAYPIRFKFDRKYRSRAHFWKVDFSSSPTLLKEIREFTTKLKVEPLRFLMRRKDADTPDKLM